MKNNLKKTLTIVQFFLAVFLVFIALETYDESNVNERIGGSIASAIYCLDRRVDIFRVHDVQQTRQAIEIYNKIICSK